MTRLRFDVFEALCNAKNLHSDGQRAKALDISQPHMTRMKAGECGAGRKVIRNALALFGPIRYEDLFEEVAR